KTVTRSVTLSQPTRDAATIRHWAGQCLKTVPLDRRLRLLGVKVESLQKGDEPEPDRAKQPETLPLFDGV
ncbi:MAG: DNA polymerase IV, partial [Burkholderiales bacterium]|nr:DNA polymerase IV [Burkholderiales bacterium]